MKTFININALHSWFFNRFFDEEIAYIKSLDQRILFATDKAQSILGISENLPINHTGTLVSDINVISGIEQNIISETKDVIMMEAWSINNEPEMLFWIKKALLVNDQIFFVVEKHINGDFSVKNLLHKKFPETRVERNYSMHTPKITEQEKAVLFLLINGLSTFEIAEILCVAEGTIRGHIYNKVTKKFQLMGYEVISRGEVIEVAKTLGYGNKLPIKLLPYFKTSTLLLKSISR